MMRIEKIKALAFLKNQQSSGNKLFILGDSKYELIDAIDPNWQGALPYTLW